MLNPAPAVERPTLCLHFGPRVIVEPAERGGYAVTTRPISDYRARFPIAVDALDYGEALADQIGGRLLDRTGLA